VAAISGGSDRRWYRGGAGKRVAAPGCGVRGACRRASREGAAYAGCLRRARFIHVQRGCRTTADIDAAEGAERGNYAHVPGEFMKWVYGGGVKLPGLVTRREAEAALFAGRN
jgi:hypothetical protein